MKSYSLTLYVLIISIVVLSLIKYKKIRDFFSLIFSVLLSLAIIVFLPYSPVKYQYIIIWMSLFFLIISFFIHSYFFKSPGDYGGSNKVSLCYLILMIIVSCIFLLKDLGVYAGIMLCWEKTVTEDFGRAFFDNISIEHYIGRCFLWDDGLVSSGARSFLYGSLTYGLLRFLGFSPWTLRISSVIFTLLSAVLFFIIGRRFYGPSIGVLASLLFILNTGVLFYGRYGTSLAATVTVTLLAILDVWTLIEARAVPLWRGILCAFILFIATLHYSPARLFVMLLLCQILIFTFYNRRHMPQEKLFAVILIFVTGFSIFFIEKHFNTTACFFNARGEQYFNFCKDDYYIKEYLGRPIEHSKLTFHNKIELLYAVLRANIPQYFYCISPLFSINPGGVDNMTILDGDPPKLPLYYVPFFPFLIFGLCHSGRRIKDWKHAAPLAWLIIITIPILLTNRVDSHRTFLLTIPVTLFISFGFWEFWQMLKNLDIPRIYLHIIAVFLIVTVIYYNGDNLFYKEKKRLGTVQKIFILNEVNLIPCSVSVASILDCRIAGSLDLLLLEKARLYKGFTVNMLEDRIRLGICDEHKEIDKSLVEEVERLLDRTALVLIPGNNYTLISSLLKKRGHHVVFKKNSYISLFIVYK